MAHVGRCPFGVEERTCFPAEGASGERSAEDLHHQRERTTFRAADGRERAGEGGSRVGGRTSVPIHGPIRRDRLARFLGGDDLAACRDRQGKIDDERCAVRQRCGEGERVGAEHGAPTAVEGHRLRRVAEDERDQTRVSEAFGVCAHLTEVVGAMHRCRGDALRAGERHQALEGEIDRGVGKAVVGVDTQHTGRSACRDRHGIALDLPGADLRSVGGYARETMRRLTVRFRCDQRARRGRSRGRRCAAGGERGSGERLRLDEQEAHRCCGG